MASRKQERQLQQAREAGQIEPEMDTETGKMINPHNPEFITKRPWYLGESGPSLVHHSKQKVDAVLTMKKADELVQQRWATKKKVAAGYRKGACNNCGAMGHKASECVERPRSGKKAAMKTGMDIAADDVHTDLTSHGKVSFDAKRDRWLGYHPDEHKHTIERFNKIDQERRRARREEAEKQEERRKAKEKLREIKKAAKATAAAKSGTTGAGSASNGGGANGTASASGGGANGTAAVDSDDDDSDVAGGGKGKESEKDSDEDTGSDSDASDYDSDEDGGSDDEDNREFVQKDVEQRDFQARTATGGEQHGRVARQGGLGGAQMKTTVRNLRIREDRAKYLYNLDPNSAYYDPKTRAMRDNPMPETSAEDLVFAGDNFIRYTGDVREQARTSVFAWEAADRGQEVHPVADPSQAEMLRKKFDDKKTTLKEEQKQRILDKYGGSEHLDVPDARLLVGQTESYVEYDRTGRVVKGAPKAVAKSKYEENVFPSNHTSVWGSYFDKRSMKWGFSCCHSLTFKSYCTGEEGKVANDEANSVLNVDLAGERKMLEGRKEGEASKVPEMTARSDLYGEGTANVDLDEDKLKEAVKKQKAFLSKGGGEVDDRKRKYNSMTSSDVTKEDMEAYRLTKANNDDPLANLSSDVLLEEDHEKSK
ncbi:unnamed protein product [Ectocarpus sp. 4 AP-2014]